MHFKREQMVFAAEEVILMRDLNNCNPEKHPMRREVNKMWVKAVVVSPGKCEYKFLVDGQWKEDSRDNLHLKLTDDFVGSSAYELLETIERRENCACKR